MAHLDVQDLTVRYPSADGEVTAVDGLHLAAERGEVVAVLGPSGCGKSTLLRAIAGLEPPSGGRVVLAGHDLAGVRPDRRNVGLMFQDHALFPHRSVRDNVAFGLKVRGRPRDEVAARVASVLDLVDLSALADRLPTALSGGEQQRVALARAIAPSPPLLMLDEPLGSLDRELRDRLLVELPRVFAEIDATVLYVTHDHDEALTLADRVAVMQAGRLRQLAAPDVLWRSPADVEVARFLGLTQLSPTEVRDGTASSPFGRLPARGVADGPATLLVLPDAVRLADDATAGGEHGTARRDGAARRDDEATRRTEGARRGDEVVVAGTVRSRRFAGDRVHVDVATDVGIDLAATVRPTMAPAVGTRCQLAIDPAHLRLLPPA